VTPYYAGEVRKLDPKLSLTDTAAYAAAMLLCALKHGAVDADVIKRTGVPLHEGKAIAWRLRRSRVWQKKVTHAEWSDPETGGIAFWMDACVGAGLMKRGYGPRTKTGSPLSDGEKP
jgi:hypothetical protein